MILDASKLKEYITIMTERINEISKSDHIIHGYMIYQCEHCHNVYVMWLEKGLEDPTDDQKTEKHKAVPFGIICPSCGGTATHTLWSFGKDSLGRGYKSYKKYVNLPNRHIYRNFFWNDPTADCGVPIIFEPDYYGERLRYSGCYMSEICINTLSDEEYEEFKKRCEDMFDEVNQTPSSSSIELVSEMEANRKNRRHPKGDYSYKRSRSNKKLYEY